MAAGLLASCSDSMENAEAFLNGTSKTPINVSTSIGDAPTSRAFDKTFEEGDKLFACIEAGKPDAQGKFEYEGQFRWAKSFTMGETVDNGGTPEGTGLITTSDKLSPVLYWDDFSSTEFDLRENGRGIRLKYGYCFNGGTPSTALDEAAGTLGWTVNTNQSTADAMKQSDLLYAATQPMIKYGHNQTDRGTLTLPYTHAMSKVTINVTAGEGFLTTTGNFKETVLTLKKMQTKASVNAPAATVTASSDAADIKDITTFNKAKTNTTATYQAIIAPTNLSAGNVLAHITNIDGNDYDIPVTQGILDAWKAENRLIDSEDIVDHGVAQAKSRADNSIPGGTGYTTKQGIHYILNVTVNKQKITIRATITDWDAVSATGVSQINFAGDVTATGSIASELKANGFDVYKSSSASSFTQKSTTVTNVSDVWTYSPVIYWAGQNDNSYFRAVSPAGASTSALAQGIDLMWGTSGTDAVTPRTGDVPLKFEHLMSKLCVKLETSSDASKVDLTDATIKITNLANTGSYSIVDATVTAGTKAAVMLEGKPSGFNEFVIPQTIADDARLVITLKDGTTYSLQLNQCVKTGTTTPVSAWAKGEFYTYTIKLTKQEITFSAEVKDWVPASGTGNATLDWD